MLLEIYDRTTMAPLAIEQVGQRYELPKFYDPKVYRGLDLKYPNSFSRPYADPTHFGYRNPVLTELKPGFECLMIDDPHERAAYWEGRTNAPYGTKVRIDKIEHVTIIDRGMLYVFYHCIEPKWSVQCFVPMDAFLNLPQPHCGGPETRYWVKE